MEPSSGNELSEWVRVFDVMHQGSSAAVGANSGLFMTLGSRAINPGDPITVGGITVYDAGDDRDILTMAHLAADNTISWAHGIVPSAAGTEYRPMTASVGDAVIVAMNIAVAFDVAGTPVNGSGGSTLLVAQISASGADWVATFGDAAPRVQRIAANNSGEIVLALGYESDVDLGGGSRSCSPVILKLDASGERVFDRCMSLSGDGFFETDGLAIDGAGDVLASGFPMGTLDVGLGEDFLDASTGGSVLFKMSGGDGSALWSKHFRGAYARNLVPAPNGDFVTSGHVPNFNDETLIAGDSLAGCTRDESYPYHITRLDSSGTRLATVLTGRPGNLMIGSDGRMFVAGSSNAEEPFLPGIAARTHGYFVELDANWNALMLQEYPADGNGSFSASPVLDGAGDVYAVGTLIGDMTLDSGDTGSVASGYSSAVVRFATGG